MTGSPILWLLVVLAVVAILVFARLKARPIQPNLTMAEAWDRFVTDLEKGDIAGLTDRKAPYQDLSVEQRQEVKDNLLEIERVAAASQTPMIAIRAAAIKFLSGYVFAEQFLALTDAQQSALEAHFGSSYSKGFMWDVAVVSDLTGIVLRHYYAKAKYDDAAKHDWFDYYYAAAKQLAAGQITCMVTVANDPTDTISAFLADQYVNLFEQLKTKVLDSPQKMPFDFSSLDNVIVLPEPPSNTRTRKTSFDTHQIIDLSTLMEQRLTGILSGNLYIAEGAVAPNAGDYFGLDAGILLSLLTVNLADGVDPEQYWKQIVNPVLSKIVPNLKPQGIEDVLGSSRAYRDRWLKHEPDDAPLAEILPFGIAAAYGLLDVMDSETFNKVWKRVFPTVVEDASKFVESFYRIFDSSIAS